MVAPGCDAIADERAGRPSAKLVKVEQNPGFATESLNLATVLSQLRCAVLCRFAAAKLRFVRDHTSAGAQGGGNHDQSPV